MSETKVGLKIARFIAIANLFRVNCLDRLSIYKHFMVS